MVQMDYQIRQMKNPAKGWFPARILEKLLIKLYEVKIESRHIKIPS